MGNIRENLWEAFKTFIIYFSEFDYDTKVLTICGPVSKDRLYERIKESGFKTLEQLAVSEGDGRELILKPDNIQTSES